MFGLTSPSAVSIWPLLKFESDYELLDKIGEGKFGEVFKVENRKTFEIRAAKFMKCSKASEKLKVRDEIDLLHEFDHQNILKLVAAFEDSENFVQGSVVVVVVVVVVVDIACSACSNSNQKHHVTYLHPSNTI